MEKIDGSNILDSIAAMFVIIVGYGFTKTVITIGNPKKEVTTRDRIEKNTILSYLFSVIFHQPRTFFRSLFNPEGFLSGSIRSIITPDLPWRGSMANLRSSPKSQPVDFMISFGNVQI